MSIQGTFGSCERLLKFLLCHWHVLLLLLCVSPFCVQKLMKFVLYHSHVQYLSHSFADKFITQEVIPSV